MKICVMSDLHLEFEGPSNSASRPDAAEHPRLSRAAPAVVANLVLLPGDIHTRGRGPEWAASTFPNVPVVMLGGNHEPYGDSLFANISRNRRQATTLGRLPDGTNHVTWLERETWAWTSPAGEQVRVVGATLWTDFNMFGPERRMQVQATAQRGMTDFHAIRIRDGTLSPGEARKFTPEDAARIHWMSANFIKEELGKPFDGITIVATHHAPSLRSVPERYRQDPMSAAYASDLEALLNEFQPDLWVHGHMHTSFDYSIGSTRVICNPRGYWPDELNPDFKWGLVIDVSARVMPSR